MADFYGAVLFVLRHEGGLSRDPEDPGGVTKYGISSRAHPDVDVERLTVEEAVEIYRKHYWLEIYDRILVQDVANKIFDFSVNMGHERSHRLVQTALNEVFRAGLKVDGVFGKATLSALNETCINRHPDLVYRALCHYGAEYYRKLGGGRFLRGWLLRALA